MWELDCEESWSPKNWCFWTVVLEKTLESPLDCKEIQPVHSEGDQPWVFFGRTDAKAETLILWAPHANSWLIGKRPWFWEGLGAGGEEDDRGWDGWMASLTRWMWVWVNSGSWWWTRRSGVLRFMGLQRVGHDWSTDLIWTDNVVLFGRKSLSVTLSSGTGSYTPPPWEQNYLCQLSEIFCIGIGLLSHMYSIFYLYQYGPIDIHFVLWGIIPKAELT